MAFSGEETFVAARTSLAIYFPSGKVRLAHIDVTCNLLNICPASEANSKTKFITFMWLL